MKTNRAPFPPNYALMRVLFRPVVAQLCKVHGSNIQWRGRFYGVAVASDIPKDDRRKRIPKAERKSMVESYVQKDQRQCRMLDMLGVNKDDIDTCVIEEDDTKFLTASSPVLTEGNGRVPRTCKEMKVVEADEASSDDFLRPNVSSTNPIHDHASTGFDGLSRDTSLQTTNPNVPQKKLSFWESLRSFAGNIISGWRKS
ncbi:hypothetical protein Nepgr_019373 [Nepenthes gracilis]|uniref:Uncharacterized protein n=1 Tax=Nepenthes gracilis TaxID=150966 RepID=A0AAD3XTZ6_NEPGR|nr:hypothetical protein Nepgr_019373 [Nepenthes gracilis]